MRLQFRQDGQWLTWNNWHAMPAEAIVWRVVAESGEAQHYGSFVSCSGFIAEHYVAVSRQTPQAAV